MYMDKLKSIQCARILSVIGLNDRHFLNASCKGTKPEASSDKSNRSQYMREVNPGLHVTAITEFVRRD